MLAWLNKFNTKLRRKTSLSLLLLVVEEVVAIRNKGMRSIPATPQGTHLGLN